MVFFDLASSLRCSSFFGFNQLYLKAVIRYPPKRNYSGDYRVVLRVHGICRDPTKKEGALAD